MTQDQKTFVFSARSYLPSKCKWALTADPSTFPHTPMNKAEDRGKILSNILQAIGQTPLVKLNHIPKAEGIKCEILAKCEFLNPGGSVKDRATLRMVENAEKEGRIKPGATIIETTSGNSGIGLAMIAAVKGYRCICVMSERMSHEKVLTLKSLGAEVVITPGSVPYDSPHGLIAVAQKLNKEIANSIFIDQLCNPGNPLAHYDTTIEEILSQTDTKIDVIVTAAGTGGTLTGIGRKLKQRLPDCKLIGVDAMGSVLALPDSLNKTTINSYEVEGVGDEKVPNVLDHSVVDSWIKVGDKESFTMARRLIKEEGLLVGGSSGSIMVAALKVAKDLKEGQRCVILLPDGIRNYMTKFVNDQWMISRDFIHHQDNIHNHWWWDNRVSNLNIQTPRTILKTMTCDNVLKIMINENYQQLPIVDEKTSLIGMISVDKLTQNLINQHIKSTDAVEKAFTQNFFKVTLDSTVGYVSKLLENEKFVVVIQPQRRYGNNNSQETVDIIIGIITPIDLVSYITSK